MEVGAIGATLGAALLWIMVAYCAIAIQARPFRALGILVAGMALHNVLLMLLIRSGAPEVVIRITQAWKEVILLGLAIVMIARLGGRVRRIALRDLGWLDWVVLTFAGLAVAYAIVQQLLSVGEATLAQRLLGLRLILIMPFLYMAGRVLLPRTPADVRFVYRAIAISALVVAAFGFWELWLVPTAAWVDWGAVGFSRWLGFNYAGPEGLPANFFQSLGPGVALRRMVSTNISPLGIAYTGLLLAPLAAAWLLHPPTAQTARRGRRLAWLVLVAIVAGIGLSVTRLALLCLIVEFALILLLYRMWLAAALGVVIAAAAIGGLYIYPQVGPLLGPGLQELPSVTRVWRVTDSPGASPSLISPSSTASPLPSPPDDLVERSLSRDDPSVTAHLAALLRGIDYTLRNPLGTGPGSALPRFGVGELEGPSESALLRITGELGLLGGALYLTIYIGTIVAGGIAFLRHRRGWPRQLGMVAMVGGIGLAPVMLTSDVWGNFSVTFLYWWLAGLAVSSARMSADAH